MKRKKGKTKENYSVLSDLFKEDVLTKNKQRQLYKNQHLWEHDDKHSIALTYYYDDEDGDEDDGENDEDVIKMIMLAAAVTCSNLHILSKQKS